MQGVSKLSFHHVGYAVRTLIDSRGYFEAMGFEFFHESTDENRNLDFLFGRLGSHLIELISPHDIDAPSAVTNMIKKQPCTQYHVCFETNNWDEVMKHIKDKGFKQIGKVIISDVYGYKAKGVFLFSKGTGLIELIEKCDENE